MKPLLSVVAFFMIFKRLFVGVLIILLVFGALSTNAWGFWGHMRINYIAVFTLPPKMIGFYKSNIDYLSKHATDADKRRYVNDVEAAKHYIDLDLYHCLLDSFPKTWAKAKERYPEDTLKARGILPWNIQWVYYRLVEAMKVKDLKRILRLSADLGHYISDAHVPLHTTSNYDGQKTGQKGAHALWESRLPELYGDNYDYFVGQAQYIENPLDFSRKVIKESHVLIDTLLSTQAEVSKSLPDDAKFSFDERNGRVQRQYSREFSSLYHKKMNGMVEKRMQEAILATGSLWYSAWVDAGQPDLDTDVMPGVVEQDSLQTIIENENIRIED